jgi:hypothetical protein
MGERLACLYWTGQAWDVPRLARRAARLPKGSRIGGRIESPDDGDARESRGKPSFHGGNRLVPHQLDAT